MNNQIDVLVQYFLFTIVQTECSNHMCEYDIKSFLRFFDRSGSNEHILQYISKNSHNINYFHSSKTKVLPSRNPLPLDLVLVQRKVINTNAT